MQLPAVENGQNDCFWRPVGRLRHDAKLGRLRVVLRPETDVPISTSVRGRGEVTRPSLAPWSKSRTIAQCFLRLSNLDATLLDRVGSYEARLWRQAVRRQSHERIFTTTSRDADMAGDEPAVQREWTRVGAGRLQGKGSKLVGSRQVHKHR